MRFAIEMERAIVASPQNQEQIEVDDRSFGELPWSWTDFVSLQPPVY
jgi:hypothetical protein